MLKCKNCGEKLTKFNKEICPYCGCKNPFDDKDLETDTTGRVDIVSSNSESSNLLYSIKKKSVFVLLTFVLGIFGIEFLYLKNFKKFVFAILINIICVVLFTLILSNFLKFYIAFLISLGIAYALNFIFALLINFNIFIFHDENGELLK